MVTILFSTGTRRLHSSSIKIISSKMSFQAYQFGYTSFNSGSYHNSIRIKSFRHWTLQANNYQVILGLLNFIFVYEIILFYSKWCNTIPYIYRVVTSGLQNRNYTEKNSWSNFTRLCRLNLGHKDI